MVLPCMPSEDEMAESPRFREDTCFSILGPSHATACVPAFSEVSESQRIKIVLDWIKKGEGFGIVLHAFRGRHGRESAIP